MRLEQQSDILQEEGVMMWKGKGERVIGKGRKKNDMEKVGRGIRETSWNTNVLCHLRSNEARGEVSTYVLRT